MFRRGSQPYHSRSHQCCTAIDEAKFLSIASIPGLSTENVGRHTVPINPSSPLQKHGGLTLKGLLRAVSSDPSFNGHFCFWFMDNDVKFIMDHRDSMKTAVTNYLAKLKTVFQGVTLERLYLTTVPFRVSDFHVDRVFQCCTKDFKMKFNMQLRKVFSAGKVEINGIPVTLVDLNICFPEIYMYDKKFYCIKEANKVHFRAFHYKKFLELLYGILETHGGLVNHSIPFATAPSAVLNLKASLPPLETSPHPLPLDTVLSSTSGEVAIDSPSLHSEQLMEVSSIHEEISTYSADTLLPQTSTFKEVSSPKAASSELPDVLETSPNDKKPKKSKKRGKHSKNRGVNPFHMMGINCDSLD